MFTVAGVLTALGTVSPAAVAIIAPIALRLADKHRISPLLMELVVVHGAQARGFSPLSIYGGITNQVVERAGLPRNDFALFMASLVFNTAVAVLIYFVLGGHRAARHIPDRGAHTVNDLNRPDDVVRERGDEDTAGPLQKGTSANAAPHFGLDRHRALTLLGLIALGAGSLAFGLCYIGGGVSAFASSVAVLGATTPLAVPFLLQGHVHAVGVVAAVAVSSTIVDVSPFSTNGALVGANAHDLDKDKFTARCSCTADWWSRLGPFSRGWC